MTQNESTTPSSNRQILERLLSIENPDADFTDEEILFSHILDDYEDYARLLAEEQLQSQRIAQAEAKKQQAKAGDGLPHLNGANAYPRCQCNSIFDLAKSA